LSAAAFIVAPEMRSVNEVEKEICSRATAFIDTNCHGLSRGNFFLNFHVVRRSGLVLQRVHTLSDKVFN
jgi:hypothetical protein